MKKFLLCAHCKNLVGVINDSGVDILCCGQPMTLLTPNTTDAAQEKHVPALTRDGNCLTVTVGSVTHPMTPEHFIDWIAVEQGATMQRVRLDVAGAPTATFTVADGPLTVYAYCNLHGLWSAQG